MRSASAYDAFGNSSTFTADAADTYDPVGFGGQHGYYRDYSGLYLLTHRYYDAGAGRFLTRDPSGYGGGMNLYGYADGNPVNESDPSGFAPDDSKQLSFGARFKSFIHAPQFAPGSKERRDYSGFLSQLPGIGTVMAAHQAITGRNAFTGIKLTRGQQTFALGATALAIFGIHSGGGKAAEAEVIGETRGLWTLTEEGAEKIMMHARFGKFFKSLSADEWWSVDTAGHGGSAFKVFKQEGRNLKWIHDANQYGDFIRGKHKGPTGLTIPLSEFRR